jgi:uncharacterized protein (TIGR03000 family)
MSRLLLGAAAALLLPTAAPAQIPASVASGVGNFGDYRNRMVGPALAAPVGGPLYRPGSMGTRIGVATPYPYRGVVSGYGYNVYPFGSFYSPYASYYGGGFLTGYGYGYGYSLYFVGPGPFAYDPPVVDVPPPQEPTRVIALSNEYPATLTMDFPAAAKVWLDGKEVAGEASAERVLTSPVLRPGEKHTFKVRAEWAAGGKTYEYTRDVTLGSGERSKVLVMSGTEKK